MNTLYKILLLIILVIGLTFNACCDADEEKVSGTPLKLTASEDTIILVESEYPIEVITFIWNKGIDRPAYNTVMYIFRLDMAINNFEASTDPDTINHFKKSYSNLELNKTIIEKWGVYPGEFVNLKARVVAKINGPKFIYPEIAYCEVAVQTFVPQPKLLSKDKRVGEITNNTAKQ
ncbi:MAG: SusE domain-containing protein [Prevotella sp.]|jgi:hypothetical protein|nr:SusE domain-containing protein [Prevotella sp.]